MNIYLFYTCSGVYLILAALITARARQKENALLGLCCCWTALWAFVGVYQPQSFADGVMGFLDLGRILAWYAYLLYLYRRSGVGSGGQILCFSMVGAGALIAGVLDAYMFDGHASYNLFSIPVLTRLVVSISELLLIENLFLNLPENARWHIALPCVLLGSLACFDILVNADAVLFKRASLQLMSARTITLIVIAPFLVLAAARNQRWSKPIRLSRSAVFHSATLVLSGSVLFAIALGGQLLRHFDDAWGWIAEISLIFCGLTGIFVCLSSRSARSLLDRLVVHHLFADRYDYRVQWLNCISTLSGNGLGEGGDLKVRAIRSIADAIDSPSGALFIRDNQTGSLGWASSWNMPTGVGVSKLLPLAQSMLDDARVVDVRQSGHESLRTHLAQELGPVWLVIPLVHGIGLIGLIVVSPPRMHFHVDQEVLDLLRILGQEVGTHLAEQRAADAALEARHLHEYGKRFAFVAHDIKNVSSQLSLLLTNAEQYIENPEFQRDMLGTVRSSVEKIGRLLARLDDRVLNPRIVAIDPVSRLKLLLESHQRASSVSVIFKGTLPRGNISISPESFDTIMTHLLNNALEASSTQPIRVVIEQTPDTVALDIIDHGEGMSAEFIRDELFSPLKTNKEYGSGIGAFQARELIREAAGQLLVDSEPGKGTVMRLLFKRIDNDSQKASERSLVDVSGH